MNRPTILGYDTLELYIISVQTQLTTSKTKLDILNLVYALPHELPNDLTLIWVGFLGARFEVVVMVGAGGRLC